MPYRRNDDLPADVRARFSTRCQTVFRTAWNDSYERHGDEKRAFATAQQAGQQCEDSTKMTHSLKFVKGSDSIIEGLAIPFGGPIAGKDIDGEAFGPDTDFCLEWFGDAGRPLLYHHGLDGHLKTEIVGRQISSEQTPEGIWARAQLDLSSRYKDAIRKLVEEDAVGFSSGAMPHLVQATKTGQITRWPWVELSLTPTPANPRAVVYAVKTADVARHLVAAGTHVPRPVAAAIKDLMDPMAEPSTADNVGLATTALDFINQLIEREAEDAAEGDDEADELAALRRAQEAILAFISAESAEVGEDFTATLPDQAGLASIRRGSRMADALENGAYVEHAERVLAGVDGLLARTRDRYQARTKAGRRNSKADWQRLDQMRQALSDQLADLTALLKETAPPVEEAKTVDLELLEAELLATSVLAAQS